MHGCGDSSFSSVGCASPIEDLYIHDFELEPYLRRLKPTAPGLDAIPSWFFSECSYELATIVAFIFNFSFSNGMVPEHWRRSVVTPVPKVARPSSILQFRPISVTPILSRLAEKLVVRRWLFPAIDLTNISDQFAFRPTGSTTFALTFFMHHVTRLLEEHSYVRCLLIDFNKAFDVVRHDVLGVKLAKLKLPPSIFQ